MLAKESIKKPDEKRSISDTTKKVQPVLLTEEQKVFLQDLKMEQDEGPR